MRALELILLLGNLSNESVWLHLDEWRFTRIFNSVNRKNDEWAEKFNSPTHQNLQLFASAEREIEQQFVDEKWGNGEEMKVTRPELIQIDFTR